MAAVTTAAVSTSAAASTAAASASASAAASAFNAASEAASASNAEWFDGLQVDEAVPEAFAEIRSPGEIQEIAKKRQMVAQI